MPVSPNVGNYRFPFKHIPDISAEASRQIRRNFEALLNIPSSSMFDAIIDPLLVSSDAINHRYKNLTDLLLSETWASTYTFKVGVKQHAGVPINETTTTQSISGLGDLALFGLGERNTAGFWNLIVAAANTQAVYYHNLALGGFLQSVFQNGGQLYANNVFTYSTTSPGAVNTTPVVMNNCEAQGSWFFAGSVGIGTQVVWLNGCRIGGNLNLGTRTEGHVQGGSIGYNGGSTLTVAADAYIEADIQGSLTISSASSNVTVHNTGLGSNVSVTATVPNVAVTGDWTTVSFTGVPAALRRYHGSADSLDFTGPGQVIHTNKAGGAAVKLRGKAVQAFIEMQQGGAQGISLTDSQVFADFGTAVTFALDAGCTRCLCLLSGTHQGGWGGTTDSGTNNRIITELDDTFVASTIVNLINGGGLRGRDGVDGEDGMDGFPGPPGAPGAAGVQGAAGIGARGQAGEDGEDGLDGLPGPQGAAGQTGAQGNQGKPVDGVDGEDGFDGYPGPPGPAGATGPQGPQGRPGMDGLDGDDGIDGINGTPGAAVGVTVFPIGTTPVAWPPPGHVVDIILVGGGGGGGSGGNGAASPGGGGGGGGGQWVSARFLSQDLAGLSLQMVVGAAAAGGVAVTAAGAGNIGTAGNPTLFQTTGAVNIEKAFGGNAGAGGLSANGAAAAGGLGSAGAKTITGGAPNINAQGGNGGNGGTTTVPAVAGGGGGAQVFGSDNSPGGGGGGDAATTTTFGVGAAGGAGGTVQNNTNPITGGAAGTTQGNSGGSGLASGVTTSSPSFCGGGGGGGGAGSTAAGAVAGGVGGVGGKAGGGGGGGGAKITNGVQPSGAGGAGSGGTAVMIVW